jgi:hypothetical protein
LYISAENEEDLVRAVQKTLGCPMMSAFERRASHR